MNKVQKNESILLQELNANKVLTISDAMRILSVSESTVRRLFASFEKKGICMRNNGSIRLLSNDFTNIYIFEELERANVKEKEVISEKAIKFIESGDTIFLDAGTTIAKLCTKIAEAITENTIRNLTVFTNSLTNFIILKDCTAVTLIGGQYRENRKDFSGMFAEMIIKNICFSKSFVGMDGYRSGIGFTASDFESARLLRAVTSGTENTYVLADTDKFKKSGGICFAKESDISVIITDDGEKLRDYFDSEKTIL